MHELLQFPTDGRIVREAPIFSLDAKRAEKNAQRRQPLERLSMDAYNALLFMRQQPELYPKTEWVFGDDDLVDRSSVGDTDSPVNPNWQAFISSLARGISKYRNRNPEIEYDFKKTEELPGRSPFVLPDEATLYLPEAEFSVYPSTNGNFDIHINYDSIHQKQWHAPAMQTLGLSWGINIYEYSEGLEVHEQLMHAETTDSLVALVLIHVPRGDAEQRRFPTELVRK